MKYRYLVFITRANTEFGQTWDDVTVTTFCPFHNSELRHVKAGIGYYML